MIRAAVETAYDFPAVRDGRVVKDATHTGLPKTMLAYVFNTRRPDLCRRQGPRGRWAMLFDFEWINRNLFYDRYRRVDSYFAGLRTILPRPACRCARTRPAGAIPRGRADRHDGWRLWSPPVSDGSGRDRTLRRALKLFADAGYELRERCPGRPQRR